MNRLLILATVGATSALASSQMAMSQTAASGASAGGDTIEEVVVTAEKRVEDVQKTPISMEVYSATEIAQHDITNMYSLASVDASLNFNAGGGEGFLAMRGVSSSDTTEIGSPSVPVVVDDFSSNRSWSLTTSMFDLARVEVLRGPQGTLYGHSATGGLINVVTQAPTMDFEATGSLEVGNYNTINTTGALNLPLSDTVQVRAAFSTRDHDGYRGDVINNGDQWSGQKADDEDSRGARLSVAFEPTDTFRGLVRFEDIQVEGTGQAVQSIPFNYVPGTYTTPSGPAVCNGSYLNPTCTGYADIYHTKPALGSTTDFPIYGAPWQHQNGEYVKWNFAQSSLPGDTTLTFLGGYSVEEWHHLSGGGTSFAFLGNSDDNYLPARQYQQNEEPHTQTYELRLTSSDKGPFTWQSGAYYFIQDNDLYSHLILDAGGADATTELAFIFPQVRQISEAVYAQGSYAFDDQNKLTIGIRDNRDTLLRTGIFNLSIFGLNGIPEYGTAESVKAVWHVAYDYTPTANNLLYAKADTGYKPGGFTTCGDYNPENVTTGEAGSKNRFADGRLQLNAAVFYDAYKDQQVAQFTAGCISGTSVTNAGSSRIYGLETELIALVGEAARFDVNLSYLNAKFSDFEVPPTVGQTAFPSVCAAQGTTSASGSNCQQAGDTLPLAPQLTVTGAFEYKWALPNSANLKLRLEGKYQSTEYFDSFNLPDTTQPGFFIANAYLDYNRDRYTIGLWGRNLSNETYLVGAAEATGGGSTEYQYSYGAPMTFGLRFQVRAN